MDKVGKQNSWISCLLVSAHCHLRVRDCSESFVFKYCHTAHVACTFAELLEKNARRTNKSTGRQLKVSKIWVCCHDQNEKWAVKAWTVFV